MSSGRRPGPAVVTVDARRGDEVADLISPPDAHVLFLDADDGTLVRRLADSTAPHPCGAAGAGRAAVVAERALLAGLRSQAEVVVDTSELLPAELGRRVVEAVRPGGGESSSGRLAFTVSSFGFKYGSQPEADWVVDVRFLPNPFWVPELRPLTGLDPAVAAHVMASGEGSELVDRLGTLLSWVAASAEAHGRRRLHVAVGCTGGRHRSVAVACALAARLSDGHEVTLRHRDVDRPDPR
jgi:UPF0042 nucleotide-binding protein